MDGYRISDTYNGVHYQDFLVDVVSPKVDCAANRHYPFGPFTGVGVLPRRGKLQVTIADQATHHPGHIGEGTGIPVHRVRDA